ncbi:MAG: hypothetical protein RL189_1596 [Pseudomonadota bacterium]|jgi:hypothetical protein
MKLRFLTAALLSFSTFASAQEYSMREANLSRLKPPRADMPAAIFAGHAAFMDLAQSVKSVELTDDAQGKPQVVVKSSHGDSVVFQRIANHDDIFEADISATPMSAYPEGRLLLALEQRSPSIERNDNPLIALTLYIVGKYPFASWGYGDVETSKLFSEAQWIQTGIEYVGTRDSSHHCDPRFPCVPEVFYRYRVSFENSLTGEKRTQIEELDRRR